MKWRVILHWRGDATPNELEGIGETRIEAVANAMNRAGYGNGTLAALDYWDASQVGDAVSNERWAR